MENESLQLFRWAHKVIFLIGDLGNEEHALLVSFTRILWHFCFFLHR